MNDSTGGTGAWPEFGAALARLRTERGLSQSRLAHEAGLDHSYISRVERGKREPSRETVLALATVLDSTHRQTDVLLIAAGYRPVTVEGIWMLLGMMQGWAA